MRSLYPCPPSWTNTIFRIKSSDSFHSASEASLGSGKACAGAEGKRASRCRAMSTDSERIFPPGVLPLREEGW